MDDDFPTSSGVIFWCRSTRVSSGCVTSQRKSRRVKQREELLLYLGGIWCRGVKIRGRRTVVDSFTAPETCETPLPRSLCCLRLHCSGLPPRPGLVCSGISAARLAPALLRAERSPGARRRAAEQQRGETGHTTQHLGVFTLRRTTSSRQKHTLGGPAALARGVFMM